MTRQEFSGERDLTFSAWVRNNLPDSKLGFLASDLDFILCNYKTKKLMLLEVKTRNAELKEWQKRLFNNLHRWIKIGIQADPSWEYLGFKLVQFEHTSFANGRCYFNHKEITEQELIKALSL